MEIDWKEYKAFADLYFQKEEPSPILSITEKLMQMRSAAQKDFPERLASIKGVLNSIYGVLAHKNFRLYSPGIPERVTEVSRKVITGLIEIVQRWGYRVLTADTDSLFVQVSEMDVEDLEARINLELKQFGDFAIKRDHYAEAIGFTGVKKRYFLLEKGELRVTGFERVRTDSSNYTKEVQEQVMRLILGGKQEQVVPYLREKVAGIRKASLEDIAVTKGLSKDLDDYTGAQQGYILAMKKAGLEIGEGDSIRTIPATNHPYGVAVFRDLSDLKTSVKVDYDKVIDSQIKKKVADLLETVGLSWEMVQGQGKLL